MTIDSEGKADRVRSEILAELDAHNGAKIVHMIPAGDPWGAKCGKRDKYDAAIPRPVVAWALRGDGQVEGLVTDRNHDGLPSPFLVPASKLEGFQGYIREYREAEACI